MGQSCEQRQESLWTDIRKAKEKEEHIASRGEESRKENEKVGRRRRRREQ